MNKTIRNKLRVLGCLVLSASIILAACRPEETTTKKKKKRKTTQEPTETTDEPSESTDPTDTIPTDTAPTDTMPDPTLYPPTTARDPKDTIYFGADATNKLHELDEEIFKEGKTDIISLVYDVEDPEKLGLEWPTVGIEPYTMDAEVENYEFSVHVLDTLDEIDFDSLELEDQILYETIKGDYELSLDMYGMDFYLGTINDLTGINVELPIIFATMNFDDQADVERYLTMLNDVGPYYDSMFEYEKKRAELGRSYPDEILKKVIESLEAVYKDHDGNYMYTTFEDRINAMDLDASTKQDLIARNKEILDTSFFPGYERLAENMKTLYGTAMTNGNVCDMPGGKEFYEKYFQYRSGTNLTIDEAKAILEGLIQQEFADFYTALSQLNSDQYQQVISGEFNYTTGSFESDVEFCRDAIKSDFPDLGEIKYSVYHIPEEMSKYFSPAAYMSTPYDDITKNVLMINDKSDGLGEMLTTVAHEALPGHMYEAVYHMIYMNNYYQKGGTTAYKEGWSTYSEDYIVTLTDYDQVVYDTYDLYVDLLNYHMWAYVDIGVHYDGWTKDDVADYFNQYFPGIGSGIADEMWDTTVEIPCYVTPYCFGNYYCSKIINDAVAQYGNEYSMKEIHAAYLDMGASSFDILEKYMPLYVEKQH